MGRQVGDQVNRKVRLLKLRICIDQKWQIDRVGHREKVTFDLPFVQRKIRLEYQKDAVGSHLLVAFGLADGFPGRRGRDPRNYRYPPTHSTNCMSHDVGARFRIKIGVFAGRPESGKTMDSGATSVSTIDISALTDSSTDLAKISAYVSGVDTAVQSMTTSAANLGSAQTRIKSQQSFLSSLSTSIEAGISALVDADMTQESTRLQALQVQQQLGTQALSIANQSSQSILSLFR